MHPSVEDRFAIQDLLFRYARAVDERDAGEFAACFAGGQVRITGPGFEILDAGQNMATLKAMFEWTMHKVFNHEFQVEGGRATGYTYCVASHVRNQQGRRSKLDWHIRYEDELVREEGGWRFRKRHLNVGLIETLPLD
ncbi:MAG: nuclear transport factor 2 family protein [Betaproteobacteria bacterium]|nr:nuclear transport factor 2 family protein [Rhodocyclales bacterium]